MTSTGSMVRAYLVCGGRWHDFDYARLQLLELLGDDERIRTRVGEDYRDLHAIAGSDLLVTYTCDVRPTPEQQDALASFVRRGGRWLALHGTNSALEPTPKGFAALRVFGEVAKVLGSQFVAHPPIQPYKVTVRSGAQDHELVRGIEPFETDDELYLSDLHDTANLQVLLETRYTGEAKGFVENDWPDDDARPVLYVHPYGDGEVVYLTLGHCRGHYDMRPMMDYYPVIERGSWNVPQYRELLGRSLRYLTKGFE